MPPKADLSDAAQPTTKSSASGKLVITAILAIAFLAAGTSWWFRYGATHRAVEFWGPQNAELIRDAPRIEFERISFDAPTTPRDISNAPGITHLRNALLEDRSFQWSRPTEAAPKHFSWKLSFSDPNRKTKASIAFLSDGQGAALLDAYGKKSLRVISTEPIAAGLHEMFNEMSTTPPAASADSSK